MKQDSKNAKQNSINEQKEKIFKKKFKTASNNLNQFGCVIRKCKKIR